MDHYYKSIITKIFFIITKHINNFFYMLGDISMNNYVDEEDIMYIEYIKKIG